MKRLLQILITAAFMIGCIRRAPHKVSAQDFQSRAAVYASYPDTTICVGEIPLPSPLCRKDEYSPEVDNWLNELANREVMCTRDHISVGESASQVKVEGCDHARVQSVSYQSGSGPSNADVLVIRGQNINIRWTLVGEQTQRKVAQHLTALQGIHRVKLKWSFFNGEKKTDPKTGAAIILHQKEVLDKHVLEFIVTAGPGSRKLRDKNLYLQLPGAELEFVVDEEHERSSSFNEESGLKIALRARRLALEWARTVADGVPLMAWAEDKDDYALARTRIYQRAGFGPPTSTNLLLAMVLGGQIVPVTEREMQSPSGAQSKAMSLGESSIENMELAMGLEPATT